MVPEILKLKLKGQYNEKAKGSWTELVVIRKELFLGSLEPLDSPTNILKANLQNSIFLSLCHKNSPQKLK